MAFHRFPHPRLARSARSARSARGPFTAALLCVALGGIGQAAAQDAATGPSLDDLLGIGSEAGDTAEPSKPGPDPEPDAPTQTRGADPSAALVQDAEPEPFAAAAEQMERAAARLDTTRDAGIDTQRLQEDVLARLDQLIADAVNNAAPPPSGGGSGGGSGSPSNSDAPPEGGEPGGDGAEGADGEAPMPGAPAQGTGSSASAGGFSPGQVGPTGPEAGPLREVRTEWGTLPARLRDELSNGLDEPFSPVYRRQTEAFYRRLAEDAAE